ncbi:hypothetical protein [Hansschlegelia zhihuaiae]|uniref:Uncharacterized protein n=1 Tax=Hansschlegelia zhihuaiae TaxID=405005 RepID=A0A4Q0MJB7_9HYPH|nr:hypothetical protein [Hansschlegelia zhihuaiae]RXF73660.1 hypothetical protein EK403_08665 [Hansschlegelia zhihuaiae]
MDRWLKWLLAVAGVAVIGAAGYVAADQFGLWRNYALFGARDERQTECDEANATMEMVRRRESAASHDASQAGGICSCDDGL